MTRKDESNIGPKRFPFTQVVGQDDAKLALLLLVIDPLIGGVLLRGEKGSAKTTLARGLAAVLVDDAPFVDLPLGATEDRLIGTLDLTKALLEGEMSFTPGILSDVDGGVLYVDEVNLLADHLVDTLLDVSVSGVNRVERDGVSHVHSAQFVLIGSMNPEEGELRPQLLDRFGLSVEITASRVVEERAEAVRRRLRFDSGTDVATGVRTPDTLDQPGPSHSKRTDSERTDQDTTDPAGFASAGLASEASGPNRSVTNDSGSDRSGAAISSLEAEAELRSQLRSARPGHIPDSLIRTASELALAVGAEGLRADLVLCRAAGALAGLDGRATATEDDLRRVAPLVLAHRSRRNPFDPPMLAQDQLEQALEDVLEPPAPDAAHPESDRADSDQSETDDGDSNHSGSGNAGEKDGHETPPQRDTASGEPTKPNEPLNPGRMTLGETRTSPMAERADRLIAKLGDSAAGKRQRVESDRGRFVRDVAPIGDVSRPIAVVATVRQVAARKAGGGAEEGQVTDTASGSVTVQDSDIRHAVKERKAGSLLVLTVDTSGSMGAAKRSELATGTAMGLLTDAYQRRDHVAVVTFSGGGAQTILQPTGSVEVARNRLTTLPSGGTTPLAEGIRQALIVVRKRRDASRSPFCVFLTDGRASGSPHALDLALQEAELFRKSGIAGIVLDCETDMPRLGLAKKVADVMGVACIDASDLDSVGMAQTIRSASEETHNVR